MGLSVSAACWLWVLLQVAVGVPGVGILDAEAAVEELHEAHAALDEAARHQALAPEGLGDLLVGGP